MRGPGRIAPDPRGAAVPDDLARARACFHGPKFLGLRTTRDESEIPIPGDENWRSHSYDSVRGRLGRPRTETNDRDLRFRRLESVIFFELGVSWSPTHLTISRAEEDSGAGI